MPCSCLPLSSLTTNKLRPVFTWFQHVLAVVLPVLPINQEHSINLCSDAEGHEQIMRFMNAADINITDVEIQKDH